jgi:hypothetical protein
MVGAVRLSEPVASAPFFRTPGPDAPYVVPRILSHPETCAVVSEIRIGSHIGWAIAYYSTLRQLGISLENFWGTNQYDVYDDEGRWIGWDEHSQNLNEYDFELEPWLDSGRLLWIEPGDDTAELRRGADGCPYVGIEGARLMQSLYLNEITRY